MGAPGSGKTAVSVFIFNNIQSLASEGAAVLFLNCIPVTHSSRMQLLRYMIWQLLEQRSDVLFKWIRSEGYYMRLFREATTFEALWSLFTQIVRALEEVWIVIDSIHDCSDGRERLLSELKALTKSSGLKTRIKLAISSRHATDVETISDAVMQYSSKDMQEAIVEYVSHEAFLMGDRGSILLKLSPEISAAVERLGGMTVWRGPIVRLVMSTSSDGEARQLLSRITSTDALVDSLWKNINQHPEPRRTLIMAVIRILVNVGGQFSVMQIYNALHESNPRILEGVDINILGPLVKDELSAYTSFGHGFFLMENVVRQHFQRRFFPPEYEEIENPENPSFEKPQQVLLQPQCNQNVPQWRVGALSAIYNSRGFLPALCLSLLL